MTNESQTTDRPVSPAYRTAVTTLLAAIEAYGRHLHDADDTMRQRVTEDFVTATAEMRRLVALENAPLPTPEQTQAEIDAIGEREQLAAQVRQALRMTAIRLRETFTGADQEFNISQYVRSVALHVNGPGDFTLFIEDQNTGVVGAEVVAELELEEHYEGRPFGKRLREIRVHNHDNAERFDADAAGGLS